jgi:hypothetical protein
MGVIHSPVDNAMPDASQVHLIAKPKQKSPQMLKRSFMA